MSSKKTKLELTWIGKEHRPKLEPRILLEEPDKALIDKIEGKRQHSVAFLPLFAIRWTIS